MSKVTYEIDAFYHEPDTRIVTPVVEFDEQHIIIGLMCVADKLHVALNQAEWVARAMVAAYNIDRYNPILFEHVNWHHRDMSNTLNKNVVFTNKCPDIVDILEELKGYCTIDMNNLPISLGTPELNLEDEETPYDDEQLNNILLEVSTNNGDMFHIVYENAFYKIVKRFANGRWLDCEEYDTYAHALGALTEKLMD